MFQNEAQPENRLEPLPLPPGSPDAPGAEVQRKRMLIALGILLVALVAVVLKDWDFWFPPGAEVQEAAIRSTHKSTSMSTASASTPALPKTPPARELKPAKSAAAEVPFSAAAERAVLPPLQVEVVAGNRH